MRTTLILPIAAALLLTACGSNEEEAVKEGTPLAEAAEAMADAPQPLPGLYSSTSEMIEFEVPGLSDDMKSMLQSAFAQGASEGNTYCLTAEQAENSREEMLKNMGDSDCTVQRFDVSGGNIDAVMSCPAGAGMSGDVSMTGTMDEDGADMEISFETDIPEMGKASIRMHMVTERIGDC